MKSRPPSVYVLSIAILFQAISGISGGVALLLRPDGALLRMPVDSLKGSVFHNFFLPGLCLFFFLGIIPALTCWGLMKKPKSRWFGFFNIYTNRHWAWGYALYIGLMLIFWIDVEVMVIGYGSLLQTFYGILGICIIVLTLLPRLMKYYKIK